MTKHNVEITRAKRVANGLRPRSIGAKKRFISRHLNDDEIKSLHWFAVCTPAQKEFAAWLILNQRGYNVYLPTLRKFRRVNRYTKEKRKISYPVVPRYLYLGFDTPTPDWFALYRFVLVQSIVGINGVPAQIDPRWIVENMRTYHDYQPDGSERYMRTGREFKVGDKVEVLDGPFDGHKIVVEEISGKLAKSRIKFLNTDIDVEFPIENLAKIA